MMLGAEEKAREESERLRLQERENLTEKRRRDLTLRARVAAKAEQKKLELLFLQWSVFCTGVFCSATRSVTLQGK
ncbi:hypothetical protein AALP_AA1G171000 [Arabis alpina]|uniref:Uncharacterized protein n=1 Tax=Arabis alpina TaxID=50452 RepID=A0A087HNS2_ARAAL|nr:hypothetical protein AALP_AA1G171000 [Arabis alpina]